MRHHLRSVIQQAPVLAALVLALASLSPRGARAQVGADNYPDASAALPVSATNSVTNAGTAGDFQLVVYLP